MEQNNNNQGNRYFNKSNQNLIIAGIAIIVVVAIAIIVPHLKHSASDTTPAPAAVATDTTTAQSSEGAAAASMASWNALFQKYTGRLVVFGADCDTTPHTQNQKKGTTILLMNNGDVPHTITVSGTSYTVGAYHYKTFMLNTPGNILINCDAHNSVAAITVQG